MAETSRFRFGVEVEFLLPSPEKTHNTWGELAVHLSQILSKAGIKNHIDGGNVLKNYREWSITPDITVKDEEPHNYDIELVSPVYSSTALPSLSILKTNLTTIFTILTNNFPDRNSTKCSTHIHISQPDNPFTPPALAALAKAVLYFESALNILMPTRTGTHWGQPNRSGQNPALAGLSLAQALAMVDQAAIEGANDTQGEPLLPVVKVMNLFANRFARKGPGGEVKHEVRGKTYKWDFTGLLLSPTESDVGEGGVSREKVEGVERGVPGTIEFRQPPASENADQALAWVVFGVAFVAGAGVVGGSLGAGGGKEGGTVEELWEMVEKGMEVVGWEDLEVHKQTIIKSVKQEGKV